MTPTIRQDGRRPRAAWRAIGGLVIVISGWSLAPWAAPHAAMGQDTTRSRGPSGSGLGTIETSSTFEEQVFTLVNRRRTSGASCAGSGYPAAQPLAMNAALRSAARAHAADMARRDYLSHTSPEGLTFDGRIRRAGFEGAMPWAENISAGPGSAQAVVDGWMKSAAHCANIMNRQFRAVGIGYAKRAGSRYTHYWAQEFGAGR